MVDFGSYIDPISVRKLAVSLVSPSASGSRLNLVQAVAIFDYVRQQIKYVPDPVGTDYVAGPVETLECQGGDCEDHAHGICLSA